MVVHTLEFLIRHKVYARKDTTPKMRSQVFLKIILLKINMLKWCVLTEKWSVFGRKATNGQKCTFFSHAVFGQKLGIFRSFLGMFSHPVVSTSSTTEAHGRRPVPEPVEGTANYVDGRELFPFFLKKGCTKCGVVV